MSMGPHCRPTEPFPAAEYVARLRRLSRALRSRRIDAAIVVGEINRAYLTGFQASNGILVVDPRARPVFQTDFRYLEAARDQLRFADVAKLRKPAERVASAARRTAWRKVAYEGSVLSAGRLDAFKKALPGVTEWVNLDEILLDQRAVKSPREIAVLRAAVAANDEVFARLLADVRPGMSEWEMRRLARRHFDDLSQGEAFDSIIAVGANSSRCHHHPGSAVLRPGMPLLIDLGARVHGYHSDMTRTVFLGAPSARMRKIYGIVLRAQKAAIRAIRPGRTCESIDAVARGVITRAGYGKRFDHGLGHGVGLQIHERPAFARKQSARLKAGMAMTVEPGIYIPGLGGVRIEDIVLVTPRGCEVLTKTPKALKILRP
jgi:Xaa-Pro aminopeptidase